MKKRRVYCLVRSCGSDYEVIDIHGNVVFTVPRGARTKKEHEIITDFLADMWESDGCAYEAVQHLLFDMTSYVSPYMSRRAYLREMELLKQFGDDRVPSPYPQHHKQTTARG